ncbi:hypothetical protein BIY37_11770 [Candidatus Brocadia sapporoensis]|uniref:Porin n=1 Tax=Candidatus Brocadia sapporoensis TaxID=392547 RepID=A0A1V6LXA8_9BACT|nr:hypothetical protein [Candidatus Brocadia sapporoensis]MDG6005730.1 hypothetical protein [Candidatus Brocadia sp.]OQD44781.1 hypothetical protein BIY37_11770 [Candidatus Brocadia sapporoensis]GJQ23698.1 MAG: hypothetical protein HBSAPP01_14880 [Candidatus Brocadia sapporoensis]
MRYASLLAIGFLFVFVFIADSFAQSSETEALKGKVEMLENELKEIKDLLKLQIQKDAQKEKEIASLKEEVQKKEIKVAVEETPAQTTTAKRSADTEGERESTYLTKPGAELAEHKLAPQFGGIYSKPFLRRFGRNTYLGGYMDFQYRASEDSKGNQGFDQTRFIPFIYSDISDRVKLASEIEFEHGGYGGGRNGEVILEFGTIDFLINDWINWRGGFVLTPLGKYNLVHDSPLQDFTDRPLVDQLIIPTTLTDAGMGFFGSCYPTELSKLDYEIYVTNGAFRGLDANGTARFGEVNGLRSSKGGYQFDNYNKSPGFVGRVQFSPFIGLEFGGSAYTCRYDEENENQLTLSAFDFAYQKGAFELVGEGGYAFIETNKMAKDAGITDDMWGYYVEARYHFMPSILKSWSPRIFTDNSTFTGALRWEQVQTAGRDDNFESVHWLRNRITPCLNYRYTEDTVFKLDYQINMEEKDMADIANNAFLFSVATYF